MKQDNINIKKKTNANAIRKQKEEEFEVVGWWVTSKSVIKNCKYINKKYYYNYKTRREKSFINNENSFYLNCEILKVTKWHNENVIYILEI